jgi:hypothetical protein
MGKENWRGPPEKMKRYISRKKNGKKEEKDIKER